jgi:hypothetical protein
VTLDTIANFPGWPESQENYQPKLAANTFLYYPTLDRLLSTQVYVKYKN